ncbi:MAG: CoA transferase [Acidimicrobiia bacterium]|nr:CoA transferase [Acidimicrobiia bacterium]
MSDARGPLAGTLVLELGNLIAGPYAGMLLADFGARVIKVEPRSGDIGRQFGPFQNGESIFFLSVNRGKESLCLDPKHWVSKRVLDKLVKKADVVLSNLRHGAMERMGLGEDRCRELNPGVIYATVSAFGSSGPYAKRPGIDIVFQGESGMVSITGDPKDGPRKTATTIGDYVAGTNTALAIAAALAETPRKGRRIDISLRDGVMAVQSGWNALAFSRGKQPERTGTASPFLAPNQVFEAADGSFTLAIVSDRHFEILADALERPDLVKDFPTNEDRMRGRENLVRRLSRLFKQEPLNHWIELFESAGLPVGRVLTIPEAFEDPQARHHGMLVEFEHPTAGFVRTTGSPIRLDGDQARAESLPPVLGQHTREILAEAGVDRETIDKMIGEGTVVAPS